MLNLLRARVTRARLDQVELVRSTETDPGLPDGLFDLVLMVDVYHELARPQEVLRKRRASLKPGGRLVFDRVIDVLPWQHILVFRR
jgi:SAM-dependent methyltransferase